MWHFPLCPLWKLSLGWLSWTSSHKARAATLAHTGRAPKGRQHPCHWSKVKENIVIVLSTIYEVHRSTKNPSRISVRIGVLIEKSVPFILPCRSTTFTRVCSPINKTGTPKTSVIKHWLYLTCTLTFACSSKVSRWGFSGSWELLCFISLALQGREIHHRALLVCHIHFWKARHRFCHGFCQTPLVSSLL